MLGHAPRANCRVIFSVLVIGSVSADRVRQRLVTFAAETAGARRYSGSLCLQSSHLIALVGANIYWSRVNQGQFQGSSCSQGRPVPSRS